MIDFQQMRDRIALELGSRTDLYEQIGEAIKTAIRAYEENHHFFNEATAVFNTEIGEEFAPLPAGFVEEINVKKFVSDNFITMRRRSFLEIDQRQFNKTNMAQPFEYAIWNEQFRFYPRPDAVYEIHVAFFEAPNLPEKGADRHIWMTKAEVLIRSRAKREMFEQVLYDTGRASQMAGAEQRAFTILKNQDARRIGRGFLKKTQF